MLCTLISTRDPNDPDLTERVSFNARLTTVLPLQKLSFDFTDRFTLIHFQTRFFASHVLITQEIKAPSYRIFVIDYDAFLMRMLLDQMKA